MRQSWVPHQWNADGATVDKFNRQHLIRHQTCCARASPISHSGGEVFMRAVFRDMLVFAREFLPFKAAHAINDQRL
jgi:hypothetical protein